MHRGFQDPVEGASRITIHHRTAGQLLQRRAEPRVSQGRRRSNVSGPARREHVAHDPLLRASEPVQASGKAPVQRLDLDEIHGEYAVFHVQTLPHVARSRILVQQRVGQARTGRVELRNRQQAHETV